MRELIGEHQARFVLERWPEDGETMEFKLIYRGPLPSSRNADVGVKHDIRRQIHPQLRNLWRQHPALSGSFDAAHNLGGTKGLSRVEDLARQFSDYRFNWVPLVKKAHFACALDVLLLKRGDPFRVLSPLGDLDNRFKTLIDGLRKPGQSSELGGRTAQEDEDPFFVLMDDDEAVFQLQVNSDRLLLPAESNEPERDVVALISVRVTTLGGHPISYLSAQF